MWPGCAYRRRTGSCGCVNAPIGCKRDALPAAAPFKISFPTGATSYRELREGKAASGGVAPHAPQAQPAPRAPLPDVAPRAPCALPRELPVGSSKLPALGWRCSAADAAEAAAVGAGALRLLHADGDEAAEAALGAAPRDAMLCTCVPALPVEGVAAAVAAAASRLGKLDVLLLRWDGAADASGLEEAFGAARDSAVAAGARFVGLQCGDVASASRCLARLLALSTDRPVLLALPLSPATGKLGRALLGLCRRSGVRVVALAPTGSTALAASPALAAAAASRACAPADAPADALLAWCIGREVIALPAATDFGSSLRHAAQLAADGGARDLAAATRSALDAAGDALAADA
jgi:hypothetical protein